MSPAPGWARDLRQQQVANKQKRGLSGKGAEGNGVRSRHRGVPGGDAGRLANDLKVGAAVAARVGRGAHGKRGTAEEEERGSGKVCGRVSPGDMGVASGPQGSERASAKGEPAWGSTEGTGGGEGSALQGPFGAEAPTEETPEWGTKREAPSRAEPRGRGSPPLTGLEMGTGEDRPEGTRGKERAPR